MRTIGIALALIAGLLGLNEAAAYESSYLPVHQNLYLVGAPIFAAADNKYVGDTDYNKKWKNRRLKNKKLKSAKQREGDSDYDKKWGKSRLKNKSTSRGEKEVRDTDRERIKEK